MEGENDDTLKAGGAGDATQAGAGSDAALKTDQAKEAPPAPTMCRIVAVYWPDGQLFDGATMAPAIVTSVADDGSINVHCFAPNGGADQKITGLKTVADRDALPEGDPGKNLPVWGWPPRA